MLSHIWFWLLIALVTAAVAASFILMSPLRPFRTTDAGPPVGGQIVTRADSRADVAT